MIQFLRQKCCCGGPCPCAVSDDFSADTIADYDVTGTFAVAAGVLTASTAGAATQALKLPSPGSTRAAGVKADVIDDSHALFGLVIGSGDNRLEWQWDVAGTQCTFTATAGGSAIVTESYAGAPTTSLEIQIVPNDCSWDVTLYRDGVLVDTHTAVAVTFDADWTAFGVVADASGGTWDNLCLRSCITECTTGCGDLILPIAWKLTASGLAENASWAGDTYGTAPESEVPGTNNYPCEDGNSCGLLNGEWFMLRAVQAGAWNHNLGTEQDLFSTIPGFRDYLAPAHISGGSPSQDPPYITYGCSYLSVYDGPTIAQLSATDCDTDPHAALDAHVVTAIDEDERDGTQVGEPTAKTGIAAAIKEVGCQCDDNSSLPATFKSVVTGNFMPPATPGYHAAWFVAVAKIEISGSYYFRFIAVAHPFYNVDEASQATNTQHAQGWAVYYKDVLTTAVAVDATGVGLLTLDLYDGSSGTLAAGHGTSVPPPLTDGANRVCTEPSTITLEPITSTEIAQEGKLSGNDGCGAVDGCTPLYSEHGVLRLNSNIGDVCLSGPEGYSTGPWTGGLAAIDNADGPPCDAYTLTFTLECARVCEGRYAYRLKIEDGTSTAYVPFEPASPPDLNGDDVLSGLIDLCGTTSVPFAGTITDFTGLVPGAHPFADACPEMDVALQCLLSDRLNVTGSLVIDNGNACGPTETILDLTTGDILCGGVPIAPTGFDGDVNYFRGPFPFTGVMFAGYELLIYYGSGSLRYAILDASECVVEQNTIALNCETLSGFFDTPIGANICHAIEDGPMRITF